MTEPATPSDFSVSDFLRQIPYFAEVSPVQLQALAQQAIRCRFNAGQVIFLEGEPSAGLWLMESGSAKAFKLWPDGHEHILHLFGAGDTFNEIAALDGGVNPVSAAAISEVTARVIPSAVLMQTLEADHTLSLAVLQGLAGRIRQLVLQIEDLALRSVTARLARFLLERVENPALAAPPVTRALVAAHLATTPETVSRALHTLQEAGAIRFDRHRIIIVSPDRLKEIAMT